MLFQSDLSAQPQTQILDRTVGIIIHCSDSAGCSDATRELKVLLAALGAQDYLNIVFDSGLSEPALRVFANEKLCVLTPGFDTSVLAAGLGLDVSQSDTDLELEIILAMARSPMAFDFPDLKEFLSGVRLRRHVVRMAQKAELSFGVGQDEDRPAACFSFSTETNYTLIPGVSLIEALTIATQPSVSGRSYSFSCYRATEYVLALALCLELQDANPEMLKQLESRWTRTPIMSKEFHYVLLREYGSLRDPVPQKFYVPGDRVWFKNPDEPSSNVVGFEGSWVCYLGAGYFNNFWKKNEPFTFDSKCLEIYHWRHGTYLDDAGELCMDETTVEKHVQASLARDGEVEKVLHRMARFRDPSGIYGEGGCIDATRECLRWVNPGTSDITIPPIKNS